jgi:hypothetical protein
MIKERRAERPPPPEENGRGDGLGGLKEPSPSEVIRRASEEAIRRISAIFNTPLSEKDRRSN